jgi:hypothetical protein
MTYVPGLNAVANPVHDMGDAAVTGINTALSPIVTGVNSALKTVTPGVQYLEDNTALGGINNFVENKPADALALAAATFFSAGAAGEAMGAGAAATPAAADGAGATAAGGLNSFGAAGSSAITPALESGAVSGGAGAGAAGSTTGSLAGAGSITPAFGSGSVGGITGTAGTGTLGTAGTAAGGGMITPAFESLGGAPSFLSRLKPLIDNAKTANSYRSNFNNFSVPNTDRINANDQADRLTRSILDSGETPSTTGRIANQIVMNRFGVRK